MQAHTLGEVGNLGIVSLRVSSGTILPIFIEIGSYLTNKEQKISWHRFFLRQDVFFEKKSWGVFEHFCVESKLTVTGKNRGEQNVLLPLPIILFGGAGARIYDHHHHHHHRQLE